MKFDVVEKNANDSITLETHWESMTDDEIVEELERRVSEIKNSKSDDKIRTWSEVKEIIGW